MSQGFIGGIMLTKRQIFIFSCFLSLALGAVTFVATHASVGVGADFITNLRRVLKDPFLTLLATSEYATQTETLERVAKVDKALSDFKSTLLGAAVTPQSSVQVSTPSAPAPAESVVQQIPEAVATPMQVEAPVSAQSVVPAIDAVPKIAATPAPEASSAMPTETPVTAPAVAQGAAPVEAPIAPSVPAESIPVAVEQPAPETTPVPEVSAAAGMPVA